MNRTRAIEIAALVTETGTTLPAHGRLLPDPLGEPDGSERWRCVRCAGELTPRKRYVCLGCMARDDADDPWPDQRPNRGQGPE